MNFPTRASSFERWPISPVYRCYAVRYSPVFMKYLPNMRRVGEKVHRVHGEKKRHPEKVEDQLRCNAQAKSDGKDI